MRYNNKYTGDKILGGDPTRRLPDPTEHTTPRSVDADKTGRTVKDEVGALKVSEKSSLGKESLGNFAFKATRTLRNNAI